MLNQSHYRPGQTQSPPWVWGTQVLRQSTLQSSNVVNPKLRPPLPPKKYSLYPFLSEAESTPGPQCTCKYYINQNFQLNHRESNPLPSHFQRSFPRTKHVLRFINTFKSPERYVAFFTCNKLCHFYSCNTIYKNRSHSSSTLKCGVLKGDNSIAVNYLTISLDLSPRFSTLIYRLLAIS